MIHKFKFKDNHIVIDVNSGAVHIVEKIIYDLLDYLGADYKLAKLANLEIPKEFKNQFADSEIDEAILEIEKLINEGMLFTKFSAINPSDINNRQAVVKAICLHVAHDCNMRCKYCFADQGAFTGEKSLMSFETGKKAIDFLLENSGERKNLEIDFFGGEPLMNFQVVKELVKYGRDEEQKHNKNIRFTITTNGLLLDSEKGKFINSEMDNVILSIDGRPAINDNMRKTISGKGTYELIKDNYLNFIDKREGLYYVRGTFTGDNLDFSEDVKFLFNEGFNNISVEPVVLSDDIPFSIKPSDLPKIMNEYDILAENYLNAIIEDKPFEFFHFNIDLDQGPCIIKRLSGCGAGTEYVAISPEGEIFPCHQFVGNDKFSMGNVADELFVNKFYEYFNSAHVFNKEECLNCWAKFYCSGGCHANAYNHNGDIKKPYLLGCEMEKKRVECAIGIKAELIKLSYN